MAYITRVQIEECRNVRGLDIDLSVAGEENGTSGTDRQEFRHLILTGPNGSGKTGVLEAVGQAIDKALAPEAQMSLPLFGLKQDALTWTSDPRLLRDRFARGDITCVYLSARRRIRLKGVRGPTKPDREVREDRPSRELAHTFGQFLVNKHVEMTYAIVRDDDVVVQRIRAWFAALERNLRRLMEDDALELTFDDRGFHFQLRKGDGYVFDLQTLADGHAAVLAILAELLIRADTLRETRKDFTFEPSGVVVIDEIETHLHLSLQEQILPFLTELFPRFQFLVATHSPAVIASIPNAVVYDLKTRTAALSDDFRGIRYGTLMTEHFGISSEIDLDSTEKLIRLRELARRSDRTPEEQRTFDDLASVLSLRSRSLAVEVWMLKERLGQEPPAAASAAQ